MTNFDCKFPCKLIIFHGRVDVYISCLPTSHIQPTKAPSIGLFKKIVALPFGRFTAYQ